MAWHGIALPFAALRPSHNERLWSWCPSGWVRLRSWMCLTDRSHCIALHDTTSTSRGWHLHFYHSYASYASYQNVHMTTEAAHSLVLSGPSFTSRVDYCNGLHAAGPEYLHEKLQYCLPCRRQASSAVSRICSCVPWRTWKRSFNLRDRQNLAILIRFRRSYLKNSWSNCGHLSS